MTAIPQTPVAGLVDPLTALLVGSLVLAAVIGLCWPGWGLLALRRRARDFSERVYREDALKHFYKTEVEGRRPTMLSLAGLLQVNLGRAAGVVEALQRLDLVQVVGEELRLTPAGRRYALDIVRAHRLWEQHLAEHTGVDESRWHDLAEKQEHRISPTDADLLAARLGHPAFDPHGDPIPTPEGEMVAPEGRALSTLGPNEWGRVLHVEDEPESVYAQIRAIGLYPGTVVQLLESSTRRVRIWANGEEHVLAPVVAANVTVRPAPQTAPEAETASLPLSGLRLGQAATVTRLSPQCRGAERKRLLDFGILPGTSVVAEMMSPAGNLTAYRVRNTLIALRREQAASIHVRPAEAGS
jgi:DtxR family transcriptional regulator, Mn-dependent transcriptional regulator